MSLTLETADDRVVSDHLFLSALRQSLVPVEKVFYETSHFCRKFPIFLFLRRALLHFRRIFIEVGLTFFLYPLKGFSVFRSVVYPLGHSTDYLYFVHAFHSHSEIFLKEFRRDYTSAYTHCGRAYLKITLSAHRCDRYRRPSETQNLFFYVVGNTLIILIIKKHLFYKP